MDENNVTLSLQESPQVPLNPRLSLLQYNFPDIGLLPESLRPLIKVIQKEYPAHTIPLILSEGEKLTFRDLYNFPNVLLAGTIASGKTQFIYNNIITWLYKFHPAELKLFIWRSKPIDYNAFTLLEKHFSGNFPSTNKPVIESAEIPKTFDSLLNELDLRLRLFQKADVKAIIDYNQLFEQRKLNPDEGHRYLPNIVLILDDLQTFLNKETTDSLISLTQRNLYTGIYVLAATSQIMSREITLQLRANFSTRIAMKLMSQAESRRILDRVGAEKLEPRGGLLYEQGGKLMKGKQPLIENATIQAICKHIGGQEGFPSTPPLPQTEPARWNEVDLDVLDMLFEEAARLVVSHQQSSTSLIQRRLKLGYNRAGRIIDQLETAGIVGPFEGSKAREVLYPDEYSLEQYLKTLNDNTYKSYTTPIQKKETKKISPSKQINKSETIKNNKPNRFEVSFSSPDPRLVTPQDAPQKKSSKNIFAIWIFLAIIALIVYLLYSI